ncbi:MAG TPA: thiamine pyrophosphate-dependent enzyme, partial [Chthoniobacterales bacterium]|nr:thiamine pyrophosphate-dependent enzyme [Chthoniobacterales bacterium]
DVIGDAVSRARAGGPPQLVVASTLRLAGHGEHDDASYVPAEMRKEAWAQDSVQRAEQFIAEHDLVDPATLKQWRAEVVTEVEKAVEIAQREAAPVGSEEDWCALSTRELLDTIS